MQTKHYFDTKGKLNVAQLAETLTLSYIDVVFYESLSTFDKWSLDSVDDINKIKRTFKNKEKLGKFLNGEV